MSGAPPSRADRRRSPESENIAKLILDVFMYLAGPGVFLQRLAERQMLRLRFKRKPRRVGRQECKRRVFVLAVLGEIEVHAANQVPGGMAAFEELLHGELGYGQFGIEGRIDAMPQVGQQDGRQVFCAGHRRNCEGPPRQARDTLMPWNAKRAADLARNEYLAGTVDYTTVATAQATELTDEQNLLAVEQSRLVDAATLIGDLAGGWSEAQLNNVQYLDTPDQW